MMRPTPFSRPGVASSHAPRARGWGGARVLVLVLGAALQPRCACDAPTSGDAEAGCDAASDGGVATYDASAPRDAGSARPDGAGPAVADASPSNPDASPGPPDASDPRDAGTSRVDAAVTPDGAAAVDAAVVPDGSLPDGGGPDAGGAPDASSSWSMPTRAECGNGYTVPPVNAGALVDTGLVETSGVVASPTMDGVLWMHNDSGDVSRLFAVGVHGEALGHLVLDTVVLVDLEDIAAGPCPDLLGPCLWLADTGNNLHDRVDLAVVAVREPLFHVTLGDVVAARTWRFPLSYPAQPVDSEALVVAPDLSAFYLVEKVDAAQSEVFRYPAPFVEDLPVTLESVGRVASPGVPVTHGLEITAADLHPTGRRMVLRSYTGLYEYALGEGGVEALPSAARTLVTLGPLSESQGEAIAYDGRGTGLYTVSEGAGAVLHAYPCR